MKRRASLDPNVLLIMMKLGVKHDVGQQVANCVMASGSSRHNPPMVREVATGFRRPANLDESEVLMGGTVGFASGIDTMEVPYAERARMIGNAFHYELVRTIFSEMMFVPTEDMLRKVGIYKVETKRMSEGPCTVVDGEENAPMPSADEKSGLPDKEMEKEFRERRYMDEEHSSRYGKAESGTGEGKCCHVSSTKEIKISDAREVERGNFGSNERKSGRRSYEASGV